MAVFSSRPQGYKCGFVVLLLCYVLTLVGIVSPFWITEERSSSRTVNQGLWVICTSRSESYSCATFGLADLRAWFHAVRALSVVGLLLLFWGVVYALSANCRSVPKPFSRAVEIPSALGGLFALVGAIVFAIKYKVLVDVDDSVDFAWSFYLVAVGSGGAFIAAVIISTFNKRQDETARVGQSVAMSQVEGQQQGPGFQSPGMVHVVSSQAGPYSPPAQGPSAYPTAPPMYTTSVPPPQGGYYPSVYSSPHFGTKY